MVFKAFVAVYLLVAGAVNSTPETVLSSKLTFADKAACEAWVKDAGSLERLAPVLDGAFGAGQWVVSVECEEVEPDAVVAPHIPDPPKAK